MARSVFNSEARQEIGSRLRTIRGRLTQREFAARLGVGRVALSNYEGGRRLPNRNILEKYAEAGKATVDWILTGNIKSRSDYYLEIKHYVDEFKRGGGVPDVAVSQDEMAILQVLRAIRVVDAIDLLGQALERYDAYPEMKHFYADRFADCVRRIVEDGDYAAGLDLEGLIEGFERGRAGRR